MFAKESILVLLAAAGLISALPSPTLEYPSSPVVNKRVTHSGIATVNPNPNGALGSCGLDSPDSSFTVAISPFWMGQSSPGPFCGRKLIATNSGPAGDNGIGGEGNVVVVTVEDTCEGCDENHIDLSVAAWDSLTNGAPNSVVGVTWNFCNVDGQC